MKKESFFLDENTAVRAFEKARPLIHALMEDGTFKRKGLYVVIAMRGMSDLFLNSILYEVGIGEHGMDYSLLARSKAEISWRTGVPTRQIQSLFPELLQEGDTKYFGSVVDGGIVVACSGVQPWFDECVAAVIAALCRALAYDRQAKEVTEDMKFLDRREVTDSCARS